MIIENHKLKDYIKQSPEVIQESLIALRYVKPIKTTREVFHMKLKHVELIKNTIDSGEDADLIKIISKVEKVSEEDVLEFPIIKFFGILNSIRNQLETIVKAEENVFKSSEINMKWEIVEGSKRMSKYGIYNTLDDLSKEDILKHKKIMKLKYSEVFIVLSKRKEASDIQKEMETIKTK